MNQKNNNNKNETGDSERETEALKPGFKIQC